MPDETPRQFVCQGCGKVRAVLYGRSMKCGCGFTSSAQLIEPAKNGAKIEGSTGAGR